jgi:hypothetical protein
LLHFINTLSVLISGGLDHVVEGVLGSINVLLELGVMSVFWSVLVVIWVRAWFLDLGVGAVVGVLVHVE